MHFVCFADGAHVGVVGAAEETETLVDEHVVHQEISKSVSRNADTDEQADVVPVHDAEHHQDGAGDGEDEEEGIVLFEETGFGLVVVFVEDPQQSMHDVLVGEPGHEFHREEGHQDGEGGEEELHDPNDLKCKINNRLPGLFNRLSFFRMGEAGV